MLNEHEMTLSNHQNFSVGILNNNHVLYVLFHKGKYAYMEMLAKRRNRNLYNI